jgi:glycosyltransferase involved in cell wall biosynthesis
MNSHKPKSVLYLSHGKTITGGYLHEKFLTQSIAEALKMEYIENRFWGYFENPLDYFKLNIKAFTQSNYHVVISVARLSLPILLRNLFNQNKIMLVWHYHDKKDGLGWLLHAWYAISLQLIKVLPVTKVQLICVAPFWQTYFTKKLGNNKVLHFPNLFDYEKYFRYKTAIKSNEIHLGQVSFKNSPDILWLSSKLKAKGYTCFYSTNNSNLKNKTIDPNAEIRYFATQEDYLNAVAKSKFTLALPYFNEGWNRMAHESLLVGTPVVAYAKGGLSDLLNLAKINAAKNKEEVITIIVKESSCISLDGLSEYQISSKNKWINPLVEWIKKDKNYIF